MSPEIARNLFVEVEIGKLGQKFCTESRKIDAEYKKIIKKKKKKDLRRGENLFQKSLKLEIRKKKRNERQIKSSIVAKNIFLLNNVTKTELGHLPFYQNTHHIAHSLSQNFRK